MYSVNTSDEMEARLREGLNSWADSGQLSHQRSIQLDQLVHCLARRERQRWLPWTAGAVVAAMAAFFILVFSFPPLSTWAAENLPVIGQYIAKWSGVEKGWQWAEENNMFRELLATSSDQGYTFRVHRVLSDEMETIIFYTLEGPDTGAEIEVDIAKCTFNGKPYLFGKGLQSGGMGLNSDIIDGVQVGSLHFYPALPDSGMFKLAVSRIGGVKGNWNISFPLTPSPLQGLTRTVNVEQEFSIPKGKLIVTEMVLCPTQTLVKLRYEGEGPEFLLGNCQLKGPNGLVAERGAYGSGVFKGGIWTEEYNLQFQRLAMDFGTITLKLSGSTVHHCETRIPLLKGTQVKASNGLIIQVDSLTENEGKGTVGISYDYRINPEQRLTLAPFCLPSDWYVMDNRGQSYPAVVGTGESAGTGQNKHWIENYSWQLPKGARPVALISPGYWIYHQDLGTVAIKIPKQ